MNNAIVLLSGGLDSVVSLACLKDKYDKIFTLTFDYSQKSAKKEIKSAKSISSYYKVENRVIILDWLAKISTSSLNNSNSIPVLSQSELDDIKITQNTANSVWVPNRNALFINIAACFADAMNYNDIIIGANKEESATFIDNSSNFIYSVNEMLKYSVNKKINVIAPLIDMSKEEIVKKGIEFNIPFNLIYSCYNNSNKHCGKCESCIRLKRALQNCKKNDIIDTIFD